MSINNCRRFPAKMTDNNYGKIIFNIKDLEEKEKVKVKKRKKRSA